MRRFENVLLLAGSRGIGSALLHRAAALALADSARVTIADVVEDGPRQFPGPRSSAALQRLLVKDARERIGKAAKVLQERGIRVSVEVLTGTPFVETIRKVVRNKHDLVMLPDEQRRGLKTMLWGSTALHLMRKCPCPVWVVKSTESTPYYRVLAAVDPFSSDEDETKINTRILELALALTQTERGRLQIVYAWNLYGESILRGSGRTPKHDVDKMVRDAREAHRAELAKLLEPFGLTAQSPARAFAQRRGQRWGAEPGSLGKTRIHLVKGRPADVIASLVRKEHIEVIVMGTTCRTGVSGFLIGSTAETVLSQVNCSVLAVKPSGFITPVALK